MLEIIVGKKFPLTTVKEGAMIDLKEDGFFIFVGMSNIREQEVINFRRGDLSLDLTFVNDIMFFVLDIEDVIISDIPFHTGLIRVESPTKEVIKRNIEEIYPLHLFLVDTYDNTLKAMRLIGLSKGFSEMIEKIMEIQKEKKFEKDIYDRDLSKLFDTLSPVDIQRMSTARFESRNK